MLYFETDVNWEAGLGVPQIGTNLVCYINATLVYIQCPMFSMG